MKVKGVTIDTSDARQTDAGCSRDQSVDLKSRTTLDSPCLLWVISGHVGMHEKVSALPLKADILRGG